jgi:uncharacterized protein YdeI (YjbR/CyaY-like superfamily)
VKKALQENEVQMFCPSSKQDWRRWLKANHRQKDSIWLVLYKKESNKPTINWSDAVDEALCFGWIDSTRKPMDNEKFKQFFARRKPKATWSKINKDKVKRLVAAGLMTKAGLDAIEAAKQNGAWTILDSIQDLKIPDDLAKEFRARPGSKPFFQSLSKSVQKSLLQWVVVAKRPETRQKRIARIAKLAAEKRKPAPF